MRRSDWARIVAHLDYTWQGHLTPAEMEDNADVYSSEWEACGHESPIIRDVLM